MKTKLMTVGALLLAACSVEPAASAQPRNAQNADMQAIASYQLTMPMVRKVAAAMQTAAAEMQKDPKVRELQAIEQEIAALEAKVNEGGELTEAEQKRLDALQEKQDAREQANDESLGSGGSIDEMEAAIKKQPVIMNALQREGIAPREYATFMMAYLQAAMIHGLQKQGHLKEVPESVNPENLKFMAEHESELADIQKQLEAMEPRRVR